MQSSLPLTKRRRFSLSKERILEIITASLVLLFAYTAITKYSDLLKFNIALAQSPLIGKYSNIAIWVIPGWELLVTAFLFFRRRVGLHLSLYTMIAFTLYLTYMLYFTPSRPCSCGGVISQMTWTQHLIFNLIFTGIALAGVLLSRPPKINPSKHETLNA